MLAGTESLPETCRFPEVPTFAFSPWVYLQRNLVERFFNRIKHFQGIAIRHDKRPEKISRCRIVRDCQDLVQNLMSHRPNRSRPRYRIAPPFAALVRREDTLISIIGQDQCAPPLCGVVFHRGLFPSVQYLPI
jgi:hypothetical protein